MSVLINEKTRVIVQGFTGREGSFHAQQMIEYGSKSSAGVTPGKGGTKHSMCLCSIPSRTRCAKRARMRPLFLCRRRYAADAVLEAIDAGVPLVVCITEGIPTLDMVRVAAI